uniref:Uncharacterized protein n=1 Tax=Alexandrium catenella TaxID=2925 RepID=A0A7S1MIV9_ALECA
MKLAVGARRLPLPALLPVLLALCGASASRGAGSPQPAAKAALRGNSVDDFLQGLEASARRVLGHLKADHSLAGEEEHQRDHVVGLLDGALAGKGGPFQHAMALHRALWAAQGLLLRRTKELTKEHVRLTDEVEDQQARIIYAMLKQRRRLPMKSQVVLLKRPQFANSTYALQLLKRHTDGVPLYQQLEALLPQELARELAGPRPKLQEHLAAAGSEGRVHVVSSRLKNDVKKMAGELRQGRDKISELLAGGSVAKEERKQAERVLAELDGVLHKAGATNDLKVQLDAMYEAQEGLGKWMKGSAA